ncbi:MAG: AAA family ATPase [Anaerolineales bacterium]|nr:AAA family ATPase [Anaerolineales bacterium]
MKCAKCDSAIPDDARFCQNCGEPLGLTCNSCGTDNLPEAHFCKNCGQSLERPPSPDQETKLRSLQQAAPRGLQEKMLAARAEIEGERKPVTILFADIVGSTAIAEKMDPEEWKEVVSGAHHRVSEAIYRYEGTIAQLLGDGVLAFFGAPLTHEDDPIRAVHAALDIQESIGEYSRELAGYVDDFQVRIGINTGTVVIGEIGTDLHMEYLAIGDAVNVAARVETAAEPGCVLLSEDTARLVGGVFKLKDLGQLEAKGKVDLIQVYEVEGVKADPERRMGVESVRSPYVGREREMDLLNTALVSLCRGHGQIVMMLGEAGIGKSRLMEEARAQATDEFDLTKEELGSDSMLARPSSLRWLEGRALSYGGSISFWPITQLLLADLGLSDGAPEAKIKVEMRRRASALLSDEIDEALPFLARLLGLRLDSKSEEMIQSLDGEALRRQTLKAISKYFFCMAEEHPTVLVFEDMHWADPSSLASLEHLLSLTDRVPLMILCLMRVEKDHGSWRIKLQSETDHAHRTTEIHLERLSRSESVQLVDQILGAAELPEDIRQLVMTRSEGNPFYLEEVIRHLVERGLILREGDTWRAIETIAEVGIPETLQGIVLARIDRLEDEVRRTLQMASVIGKSFLYRLLEAISDAERQLDEHLSQLQRVDLVREKARLPELEYIFKHSLTQEAAYNSLLMERRKEFHRKVGKAIEDLFPDHVEDYYGLLAHHWERAGVMDKASEYLVYAGDQARIMFAHEEAIDYYQRVLSFLEEGGAHEEASRVLMKLGLTYHDAFDFQRSRQAFDESFNMRRLASENLPTVLPPARTPFRCVMREPPTLDPTYAGDVTSCNYIKNLFSGLVELGKGWDIIPDVAHRWEISEDGCTYLFHLRDDVVWSDGTQVTAEDFLYTWRRTLDPAAEDCLALTNLLFDIKGARAYHTGEISNPDQVGIRVIDEMTLEVELIKPASYFLHLLANQYPIPQHIVEACGEAWTDVRNIVTNGPFRLEAYEPGEAIQLERNPTYHGRFSGNLQRVELELSVPQWSPEELAMYEAGRVDIVELREGTYYARHDHVEEYVCEPLAAEFYVGFDTSRPPFDNPNVRRAFALSVDQERLVNEVLGGSLFYPATGGFVPPGIPGHLPGIGLSYDPANARQLIEDAGYPDGKGFPKLELIWIDHAQMLEYLKAQWSHNLNVEVTIKITDWASVLEKSPSGNIFYMGWHAEYPDPDCFLRVCIRTLLPLWQNEIYNRFLEEARRTRNQEDRIRLYQAADKTLIEEVAIIPITYLRLHSLVKPWVRIPAGGLRLWSLKDFIIEPY